MSQHNQQFSEGIDQQSYAGQGGQYQSQTMPQTGEMGGQAGGTQQAGTSHQMTHETVGHRFESEMTGELNQALESFDRVVEISEWCADKCIESGQQMAECARLCKDLADLASLNERLIARDSINGPEVAETFLRVAEQGLPILQRHQQSPHVQETMEAVEQAIDATDKLLRSIGGGRMGQQMGGQSMGAGQQTSQQPMGGGPQSMGASQQSMGEQPMRGTHQMSGGEPMGGQQMGSEQWTGGGQQMGGRSMGGQHHTQPY